MSPRVGSADGGERDALANRQLAEQVLGLVTEIDDFADQHDSKLGFGDGMQLTEWRLKLQAYRELLDADRLTDYLDREMQTTRYRLQTLKAEIGGAS